MTEPEKPEAAPSDLDKDAPLDLGEAAWEPEALFALEPDGSAAPPTPEVEAPPTEVVAPAPEEDKEPPGVVAPAPVEEVASVEAERTAVPEPEMAAEAAPEPAASRSKVVLPVVAGLTALLLLLTGFLAYRVADSRGPAPVEQSRKDAVAAGRDAARLVFSYDYRRLDKDFKAGLATTTGKFRKDYEATTKKVVGDVAPRYKAVLVAEVSEAAVITATKDRVLLLVFLNVQSQSSLTTAPKITPRRLKMTMQRQGERWLVADVDTL